MRDTTIVFIGDWIRVRNEWHQVVDINGKDQCGYEHPKLGMQWVYADIQHIDQVLSDPEMKDMLQTV
jgi:hypothetical protein|tara:strand:- start:414 stop:614 length:201 start_codon:yes stop_codon:yes gene_type:complete